MVSRKKIVLVSLGGFLFVILLTLLFLPAMIKNYAVNNSKELLGRQIAIEDLYINYFTSTLSVNGFRMFEANGTDVFTSFDTLVVNTVPYKFISGVKALDQFYLEGLTINIAKKDSAYNFDDIIAFFEAKDTVATDTSETESFKYLLENLKLKNASIDFYDGDVDLHTAINDLSFFIPVIAWDQEHESDADVTFNFENGGVLKAKSNIHPGSGEFTSTIELENLNLNSFYRYARQYANINALEGALKATVNLNGNINTPEQTLVSGNVEVLQFLMKDKQNQEFLASENISCELKEIDVSKSAYTIESVLVEKPYLRFELDSVSNNIYRIFRLDEETESDTVPDESSMYYAINTIKVTNGIMDYTDNLTGQPFDYHLSEIKLDTDSIKSSSQWVDAISTMLLNERGTLNAEVGFNPSDAINNVSIAIAIEDFLLSDLNIYSDYYVGHSILAGDMFYFSDSEIVEGQLNSQNNLVIKNVSVENNKGGLFSLPLKFAVFLLKDKNGDIALDVPVGGNLDDPQVDAWELVWTTLKKKIFNATDNPVRPLARFMNVKPEELESIAIQYPDTTLNEKHKAQLNLILSLEKQKEGLDIEMNYVGYEEILRQLVAGTAYADSISETPALNSDPDMAQTLTINDSIPTDTSKMDSTLVAANPLLDSLTNTYIASVVANVENYLKSKNNTTAIVVQKAKVSNPDNLTSEPGFKVKYALKDEEAPEKEEVQSNDTNTNNENL